MLSPKLHTQSCALRARARAGVALSAGECALLATILEDLGERVALLEHEAVPRPPARPALVALPGGRAA